MAENRFRQEFYIGGERYAVDLYRGHHPDVSPGDTVIVDGYTHDREYNILIVKKG